MIYTPGLNWSGVFYLDINIMKLKFEDLKEKLKSDYTLISNHNLDTVRSDRDGNFTVRIEIINSKKTIVFSQSFYISGTNISCGAHQLSSLLTDQRINQISEFLKPRANTKVFVKNLYKIIFNYIKKKEKIAFLLISNNQKSYNVINNSILDSLALVQSDYEYNPNSFNNIKVWIL